MYYVNYKLHDAQGVALGLLEKHRVGVQNVVLVYSTVCTVQCSSVLVYKRGCYCVKDCVTVSNNVLVYKSVDLMYTTVY